MNLDQVWRPQASYGKYQESNNLDSAEEGGRGSLQASSSTSATEQQEDHHASTTPPVAAAAASRKRAVIPRRRTPTVKIPRELRVAGPGGTRLTSGSSGSSEGNTPTTRTGYDTIETKAEPLLVLLNLSCRVYERTKIANPKTHNWYCGWTDHEHLDLHYTPKPATTGGEFDRSRLQTPADGYRSTLHSRVSSSRYTSSRGGRRTNYTFHHYDNPDSHIETYRELYGYTALNSDPSQRRSNEERLFFEEGNVEQDAEVMLPVGVKSLYQGDPYLKELVNRLGIKEPLSPELERQQQLLQAPRPTPPSIVKKKRNERESVSIMVSNSAPKR